jgi:hypothetical protein
MLPARMLIPSFFVGRGGNVWAVSLAERLCFAFLLYLAMGMGRIVSQHPMDGALASPDRGTDPRVARRVFFLGFYCFSFFFFPSSVLVFWFMCFFSVKEGSAASGQGRLSQTMHAVANVKMRWPDSQSSHPPLRALPSSQFHSRC